MLKLCSSVFACALLAACGGAREGDGEPAAPPPAGGSTSDGGAEGLPVASDPSTVPPCRWSDAKGPLTPTLPETAGSPIGTDPLPAGTVFKSLDGSQDCTCTAEGIRCTRRECRGKVPSNDRGGACRSHGFEWPAGAVMPLLDGCNYTYCRGEDAITSTLVS